MKKLFKNHSLFELFAAPLIFYCEIEGLNKRWNFNLYSDDEEKFEKYKNLMDKVFENSDATRPKTFLENLKNVKRLKMLKNI